MRVVVTEKPSVARDLAAVLGGFRPRDGHLEGDGTVITWCIGHLLELEEPAHYDAAWKRWSLDTLPMLPGDFDLRVRENAADQWKVVASLLTHAATTEVVNACDAGREGELIFRYAYQHAGCRAPVQRFWVSSLTPEAIRAGWSSLQPGPRYDALADAARCRSEADWLVGMNATRALTCRTREVGGDALWSVGRVQTPTLAMIVERDAEIEAFVPETYWQVKAEMSAEGGVWSATWFRSGDEGPAPKDKDDAPHAERLTEEAHAQAVADAARDRDGVIASDERKTRSEKPPLLYDLTALQRRANQRYGMSAQRTLEVAQALYERHKLLTYPRTDARFLTHDQVGTLPDVLSAVATLGPYADTVEALTAEALRITSRLVDDDEVGDHHAILPTDTRPIPGRLNADEKRIYDLVARRLLAALSPDAQIDLAQIVVEVDPGDAPVPEGVPTPLTFRAKGRVLRVPGWQAIDPPSSKKDLLLPQVTEGSVVHVDDATVREGQTRPPRPHDDASLLKAMETAGRSLDDAALKRALRNAGLGTPATRAAILQTLLDRAYVVREGKALRATEQGNALVASVPTEGLKSAALTGRWEMRLAKMAEGKEARDAFMADVRAYVDEIVGAMRGAQLPEAASRRTRPEAAPLGDCPACGQPVRPRGPVFTCDTGRDCPFVVFATMSGRTISTRMVKTLLKEGRTPIVKGFKSRRTGKAFEAGLLVREDGSVGLWFEDDKPRTPSPPAASGPASRADRASGAAPAVGAPCPTCGQGHVIRGRRALGCSRWREGCGWRYPLPSAPEPSS